MAFGRLQQTTAETARAMANPFEAGAAATGYLPLFGLTARAFVWARTAAIALPKADSAPFYRAKLTTARFFMQQILPRTGALANAILAGGGTLRQSEDAAFETALTFSVSKRTHE